jgi:hypothetical protein
MIGDFLCLLVWACDTVRAAGCRFHPGDSRGLVPRVLHMMGLIDYRQQAPATPRGAGDDPVQSELCAGPAV